MSTQIDAATSALFKGPARDKAVNLALQGPNGMGLGAFSGPFNPGKEIDVIIRRCCPNGRLDIDALLVAIKEYFQTIETAYAATVGVWAAELDGKPNNCFTFSGNNPAPGATYPGDTPIPLFTRVAGVIAATPGFMLQPWILIQRITADPTDAAAGWKVCGGTVIVATDPVPSFQNDFAFTELRQNIDRLDSPVAQLYNRPVGVPAQFTMSAIHYNAAPIPLNQGITIAYQDNRCQETWAQYGIFGPPVYRMPFAATVDMFVEQVRAFGGAGAGLELRQAVMGGRRSAWL